MKTKGKVNPERLIALTIERIADPEVRARLAAAPHPSPFLAERGRTMADYADAKLGPSSQLSLRAKLQVVYELTRVLDGGTHGEIREAEREREARAELRPETRVADRLRPGRLGYVVPGGDDRRICVLWDDELARPVTISALAVAVVPSRARARGGRR